MKIREKIQNLGYDTVLENQVAIFKVLTGLSCAPKTKSYRAVRAERFGSVTPWRNSWLEVYKDVLALAGK